MDFFPFLNLVENEKKIMKQRLSPQDFSFWMILGFELRASCFLGRYSTA
jgi:hypothetical protein